MTSRRLSALQRTNIVSNFSKATRRTMKDSMRSTEYDTVSDRYARFLRDELIREVGKKYNLRKDSYSHAISGSSSGGIAAFNAAWQMPDLFSRVQCYVGTYHEHSVAAGQTRRRRDPAFPRAKRSQAEYSCMAPGRIGRPRECARKLASAKYSDGELA